MSGELIVPIARASTRWHLAAEDDQGGIASVEVSLAGGKLCIDVTTCTDRYPVAVTVKAS